MMKKLFCILLALIAAIVVFSGCSDKESQSATTTVSGGSQQAQASSSSSEQASASSSGSESMKIKPEQLISKEDANKLLGEAVKAGIDDEYPQMGLSTCFYAPENTESMNYLQISVLQKKEQGGQSGQSSGQSGQSESQSSPSQSSESGGSGGSGGEEMTPKNLYEGLKKIFSDANAAVTGHIGDDIFVSGKSISILSGEYCLIISSGNTDAAIAETILKNAAEMAVENLKRIQGK